MIDWLLYTVTIFGAFLILLGVRPHKDSLFVIGSLIAAGGLIGVMLWP